MKIIELEVEDSMLAEVDRATRELEMTRDDFVRTALERAVRQREIIAQEQRHARGYRNHPQTDEEIGEWDAERTWGES